MPERRLDDDEDWEANRGRMHGTSRHVRDLLTQLVLRERQRSGKGGRHAVLIGTVDERRQQRREIDRAKYGAAAMREARRRRREDKT